MKYLLAFAPLLISAISQAETVSGTLVEISKTDVTVNIGGKSRIFRFTNATQILDTQGNPASLKNLTRIGFYGSKNLKALTTVVDYDGTTVKRVRLPLQIVKTIRKADVSALNPKSLVGRDLSKEALSMTDGTKFSIAANRGKVILLDFWATWCGPCLAASPSIASLAKEFREVRVIGANCSFAKGDTRAKAQSVGGKHGYPIAYNADALAKSLGATSIPLFVVIGKDGKICGAITGFSGDSTKEQIRRLIRQSLVK
ncbi:MAG: TlpA disulfide reductase family protein [Armatimonadota bacterium]